MTDFSNDIKLALWRNDKRTKPTQPFLKGGKPQNVGGKEMWVSAFVNIPDTADEATRGKIETMLNWMCDQLGTKPLMSVSLSPAEQSHAPAQREADPFDNEIIPF